MPPTPRPSLPARTPLFPPDPPRRSKRLAIWLAFGVAIVFIPLTYQYQSHRLQEAGARKRAIAQPTPAKTIEETGDQSVPAELRQWHMAGIDGITETQARMRFGKPVFTRDYNVGYGAFAGPQFGLKHYFLNSSPGYADRLKEATVVWEFPAYTTIREMIWKMHESYLTLWLHEPRVEVSIQGSTADAVFPRTAAGEWVVLDNYRIGQDLIKNPPVASEQTATPSATP